MAGTYVDSLLVDVMHAEANSLKRRPKLFKIELIKTMTDRVRWALTKKVPYVLWTGSRVLAQLLCDHADTVISNSHTLFDYINLN